MTATRILLAVVPPLMMIAIALALPGIEQWLATFGKTAEAKLTLGRIGPSLPYIASAAIGLIFLLSAQGSVNIKTAGWGGLAGSVRRDRPGRIGQAGPAMPDRRAAA